VDVQEVGKDREIEKKPEYNREGYILPDARSSNILDIPEEPRDDDGKGYPEGDLDLSRAATVENRAD